MTATGASPFARLFRSSAVAAAAAKAAADEDQKKKDAKAKAAEDDDEEDDKKKKDKKADDEDEDGDSDAMDDEEEEDAKKAKKKAKSVKSEGDDDSDKEDEKDPKASAARARERGRIEEIMNSAAAAANPAGAMHMAIHTATPRRAAIGMLHAFTPPPAPPAVPASSRDAARKRLESVEVPDVGGNDGPQPSGADATAAEIIAAGRRRRGEI